jgi:hypothetical protein
MKRSSICNIFVSKPSSLFGDVNTPVYNVVIPGNVLSTDWHWHGSDNAFIFIESSWKIINVIRNSLVFFFIIVFVFVCVFVFFIFF